MKNRPGVGAFVASPPPSFPAAVSGWWPSAASRKPGGSGSRGRVGSERSGGGGAGSDTRSAAAAATGWRLGAAEKRRRLAGDGGPEEGDGDRDGLGESPEAKPRARRPPGAPSLSSAAPSEARWRLASCRCAARRERNASSVCWAPWPALAAPPPLGGCDAPRGRRIEAKAERGGPPPFRRFAGRRPNAGRGGRHSGPRLAADPASAAPSGPASAAPSGPALPRTEAQEGPPAGADDETVPGGSRPLVVRLGHPARRWHASAPEAAVCPV